MICLATYGVDAKDDGAMEAVVRLPCGHQVGAECIRTWLSPDKAARNSCPACRMTFFPAQPRPYMEHEVFEDSSDEGEDEDDDEDDDEADDEADDEDGDDRYRVARNANPNFIRNVLRIIGDGGQEMPQREEEDEQELQEAQEHVRRFWPQFLGTTTEQYQESTQRARALVAESRVLIGEEGLQLWLPTPDPSGSWEPVRPEGLDPLELEDFIQHLATAYRTLPFREALSYSIMRDVGPSHHRFPHPSQVGDVRPLNAEQEEVLFREMERRCAFTRGGPRHQYALWTNRERWASHRQCGEAWDPVEWDWSHDLGSQLNEDDENVPSLVPSLSTEP